MAVAKRQEREKPVKMEQKKIHRPEWESQVKKTALLASPVCIGQAQGHGDKCIKRSQDTLLQDWGHWVWQCMHETFWRKWSCSLMCDSLLSHGLYSLPGSSVHGIFQAQGLQWVAISFSRGSSLPRDQTQVSCIAGRCFTFCTTKETHYLHYLYCSLASGQTTRKEHSPVLVILDSK